MTFLTSYRDMQRTENYKKAFLRKKAYAAKLKTSSISLKQYTKL